MVVKIGPAGLRHGKNKFAKFVLIALAVFDTLSAQNAKIKCYFNHPVNTNVSSGTNAVYLNSSFADTIAAYIDRAKYTVDIAQYDYLATGTSGVLVIATAVNNAYAKGIVVRWIYDGSSTNSGLGFVNSGINRLASPTTSAYGIMHNKFMVIDANSSNQNDAVVWTGSYDWSDAQTTGDYNNMIIIQDQNVALTYYNQFNQMWGGSGASPNAANSKFGVYKSPSAQTSFTVNGTPLQVYFSPMDNSQSHLISSINSANYEMFFGIYTFTDNTIANTIKNKYNLGIAAHGIMDQYSNTYAPYATLNPVMGANLKIYSGTKIYHNKIMLIDVLHPGSDPQVFTGSYNWTAAAGNMNDENSVVVHDSIIANQYYQSLCKNFTDVGGAACPSLVGIDAYDYGKKQFAIYPNPFSEVINLKIKNTAESFTVKVTDALGNMVKGSKVLSSDGSQINMEDVLPGIYFVIINSGDQIFTEKIIKQ